MFLYIYWYIFSIILYLQFTFNFYLVSFLKLFSCDSLSPAILGYFCRFLHYTALLTVEAP